jgi:endoglucanase
MPNRNSKTQLPQISTVLPPLVLPLLVLLFGGLSGCIEQLPMATVAPKSVYMPAANATEATPELLQQSWQIYSQRFIQGDGRIIDREDRDRSTSEGQAYALMRAVWIDDRDAFDRVLQWSETNLQRRKLDGSRADKLWAWKWGQQPDGSWGPIDGNFASDGDIDAITALIWASRRWNQPQYLDLARQKLADLWDYSTVSGTSGSRYLLPGPKEAFQPEPNRVLLNPSYFAPYAFRLFAEVDAERDWLSLTESSYRVLEETGKLSTVGLPSDWVELNLANDQVSASTNPNLPSRYGFDAYRVWWRVALDAAWYQHPQARQYLQRLQPLQLQWQAHQSIPAQIDLQGNSMVPYESTAQYAMLYAAFRVTDPDLATAIYQQKLVPVYRDGFWDNESAYYVQNLSWLGLFPVDQLPADWFDA